MLMKLDSLNEWNGSMNFYIDTDYQILPGMSVQNENPAYKIQIIDAQMVNISSTQIREAASRGEDVSHLLM